LRKDGGNPDLAIKDYDKAIKLDLRLGEAWNNRGVVRHAKRDFEGAIADYDKDITINPRFAVAYKNRGVVRQALGRETDAERDFAECLALNRELKPELDQHINLIKRFVVNQQLTRIEREEE